MHIEESKKIFSESWDTKHIKQNKQTIKESQSDSKTIASVRCMGNNPSSHNFF